MIKLEHITCVDGVNVAYLFRSNVFHFLGSFLVIFGLLITACGGDDISDDVVISTITEPVISPSTIGLVKMWPISHLRGNVPTVVIYVGNAPIIINNCVTYSVGGIT